MPTLRSLPSSSPPREGGGAVARLQRGRRPCVQQAQELVGRRCRVPDVGGHVQDHLVGQVAAAAVAEDAGVGDLLGEGPPVEAGAADHRERLHGDDVGGVGGRGHHVVGRAGPGEADQLDLAAVGLADRREDLQVVLQRLDPLLGRVVHAHAAEDGVEVVVLLGGVEHDLDRVRGDAGAGGPTVVALERRHARRGVHRRDRDRAPVGVAGVGPGVVVERAVLLGLGVGHRHLAGGLGGAGLPGPRPRSTRTRRTCRTRRPCRRRRPPPATTTMPAITTSSTTMIATGP